MAAGIELDVAAKDWHNASIGAGNLSQTRLSIGGIGAAVAAGAEAVRHAEATADDDPNAGFQRLGLRTIHADALFCAGDLDAAANLFADAERRQTERQKEYPLLYSVQGYRYCELLLSRGEAAGVLRRATQTLAWANPQGFLLDIGLDTLSLGRAAQALCDTAEAAAQLDAAVTALEDAGQAQEIPRGLLGRAELHRTLRNWDLAAADLNDSDEIADRSGMKLFQIDGAIERARLTLARDGAAGVPAATTLITKANKLIEETRGRDHEGKERWYAKPTPDVALVEARMALLASQPDAARKHLAIAKHWIDRGWKIHAPEHTELTALLAGKPASTSAVAAPAATPKKPWWRRLLG